MLGNGGGEVRFRCWFFFFFFGFWWAKGSGHGGGLVVLGLFGCFLMGLELVCSGFGVMVVAVWW